MPSVSGSQHRAMEAAAHGNSTLGISASVGKEFSEADKGKHFKDSDADEFLDKLWTLEYRLRLLEKAFAK